MFPECKCLEEGTENCNQENGQCYCKIGYSGEICDKSKFHCQLGTYVYLFLNDLSSKNVMTMRIVVAMIMNASLVF